MRKSDGAESWVVYLMTVKKNAAGMNAVCEQAKWVAMELARPGLHTLSKSHTACEAEAERLARGTSGDPPPRTPRRQ